MTALPLRSYGGLLLGSPSVGIHVCNLGPRADGLLQNERILEVCLSGRLAAIPDLVNFVWVDAIIKCKGNRGKRWEVPGGWFLLGR